MNLAQAGKAATLEVCGTEYTNNTNIPIEFAYFIAHSQPVTNKTIATSLLQPLRKLIYANQYGDNLHKQDVIAIKEQAKQYRLEKSIQYTLPSNYSVGIHRTFHNLLYVIPIISPEGEPIIVRQYTSSVISRLASERDDMRGRVLTLAELELSYPLHFEYMFELSVARLFAPDLITSTRGRVLLSITDSNSYGKLAEYSDKSYTLYPTEEVQQYIDNKLSEVDTHIKANTLPECTPMQKGYIPPEYKIQRLSKSGTFTTVRGTKSHNIKDAHKFLLSDKVKPGDRIHTISLINTNCKVCEYNSICEENNKG